MPNSKSKPHSSISQVKIIADKNNFPISWLNKQGFCEYGIFLENVKGIEVKPTKSMVQGTQEHLILENKFKEGAEPATFEEMLETSKTGEILSRELPVISEQLGNLRFFTSYRKHREMLLFPMIKGRRPPRNCVSIL